MSSLLSSVTIGVHLLRAMRDWPPRRSSAVMSHPNDVLASLVIGAVLVLYVELRVRSRTRWTYRGDHRGDLTHCRARRTA